ncbi:hypothetical protein HETIRDRAFT_422615 [Heterobasidion irregulare TC 32-1]|uniref:Uncharacterized protein n=1 Tax=Heterobasidion irregulare (strain TC 32-1) TaxID=747525 RepID=W4JT12_HETIT|nr:uncharacterized protein HETIRDRAFT_422615 [Heterobasidion irregulare TC 32-1]ETW76006.1 hypothetical protein HETIRDRAFT_422615 [Heterobasidion irregulare TC 32-1]
MVLNLYPWTRHSTRVALDVVRNVLRSNSKPMATQDIYNQAIQQKVADAESTTGILKDMRIPQPPHPEHPIRSMRFLKRTILPDLVKLKEVEKIHTLRELSSEEVEQRLASMTKAQRAHATSNSLTSTMDTWLWQIKAHKPTEKEQEVEKKEVYGKEVGVGEDWDHLNRRRQRAREGKVGRDVRWMRTLQRARDGASSDVPTSA